ncbi:MAG: patatin-like phospholipase family protein [Hyphomicrobiaceae bacterium]
MVVSKLDTTFLTTFACLIIVGLTGCASPARLPALPINAAPAVQPYDIPDARFYAEADNARIASIAKKALRRRLRSRGKSKQLSLLAISGGADDGAFGAGLLVGWTERGTRPKFDVVTGISTGALSAPFAYLGSAFNARLTKIYTKTSAEDIFKKRGPILASFASDALTDSSPLRVMIARHMSNAVVRRIAEEYGKGRLLFVLTTNLDQGRAVIWNIGAIAESRHSRARKLIVDILLASAAVPGVFPPVMLDVMVDGKRYQEMHVDGGTVAQAFLYPPSYSPRRLRDKGLRSKLPNKRVAYIIRNGRARRPEKQVRRQTLAIASQAISTMIASSGVNDTYRMYTTTKRDGIAFRLAYIGGNFTEPYPGRFDRKYMNALYQYGYKLGRQGVQWLKTPLGYAN